MAKKAASKKSVRKKTSRKRPPKRADGVVCKLADPMLEHLLFPVSRLQLDPDNPYRHEDGQVRKIAGSLDQWGARKNIVAVGDREDGTPVVMAGNGTIMAARSLGWTHFPVSVISESESMARGFALADNRIAEDRAVDAAQLRVHITALPDTLRVAAGFDRVEISHALESQKAASERADGFAPPKPETPVTKFGDVWHLGDHVLVCGDSEDPRTWESLPTRNAQLVLTDPPYGVDYVGKTDKKLEVHNDGPDRLEELLGNALVFAKKRCDESAVWYVFGPSGPTSAAFVRVLSDLKVWRQTLVWVKDVMVMGRSDFQMKHEYVYASHQEGVNADQPVSGTDVVSEVARDGDPAEQILYGWVGRGHRRPPGRRNTSVWNFPRPKASRDHPTMKPVSMLMHALDLSSKEGELVLDPFSGSGSTLLACELSGRVCHAIEFDPGYCDVAVRRWENQTGLEAVRHGADGKPYTEAAA